MRGWYERAAKETLLSDVNTIFLIEIASLLGIGTRIVRDTVYPASGAKTERLLAIARAAGATRYLSGPSARVYFDESLFTSAAIAVEWMSYPDYAEYPQLHGSFVPAVSVLDLLFNVGTDAPRYLSGPSTSSIDGSGTATSLRELRHDITSRTTS